MMIVSIDERKFSRKDFFVHAYKKASKQEVDKLVIINIAKK